MLTFLKALHHGLFHKSTAKKMKLLNIITKMGINHYKNMHGTHGITTTNQLEMLKKPSKSQILPSNNWPLTIGADLEGLGHLVKHADLTSEYQKSHF